MPSGRTHDRLIWIGLPLMAGVTYWLTQAWDLTAIASGAYLFSGLMFGPDLDIHSVQYKRWGWFRWLWLPYRKMLRHRSVLSHGFLVGTLIRLGYVTVIGVIIGGGITAIALFTQWLKVPDWSQWGRLIQQFWQYHFQQSLAFFIGLEIGAMNHALSDRLSSQWKRLQRRSGKSQKSGIKARKRATTVKKKVRN